MVKGDPNKGFPEAMTLCEARGGGNGWECLSGRKSNMLVSAQGAELYENDTIKRGHGGL